MHAGLAHPLKGGPCVYDCQPGMTWHLLLTYAIRYACQCCQPSLHCCCCCCRALPQTASILFKPEFLAAGGASSSLLEPLMRILSLGWSSAAVTNYVQGVGHRYHDCCTGSTNTISVVPHDPVQVEGTSDVAASSFSATRQWESILPHNKQCCAMSLNTPESDVHRHCCCCCCCT